MSADSLPEPLPHILARVSRSFALSLGVLPRSLRGPLGLAYLLARAADTIADTRIVPRAERLRCLDLLQGALDAQAATRLAGIADGLTGAQRVPAERELLLQLPACVAALGGLSPEDRARIRRVVRLLILGMQTDLRTFPGEDAAGLASLENRQDLHRYTYYAAGCVGEFWTEMTVAHRPACGGWDADVMRRRGVRFGQALQMTNVLRDLAQDLRIGRCYLPRQDLAACGLLPADLLQPSAMPRLRPLIDDLLAGALADYREACAYTQAIPRCEMRLRLACAWPILIGLKTLALIRKADSLLDPAVTVKVSRAAVYRILVRSGLTAWSNVAFGGYCREAQRPLEDLAGRGVRG